MKVGVAVSAVSHAALLALVLFGLSGAKELRPEAVDSIAVDLVPVVMGEGNRPFFGKLSTEDVLLGNPTTCIQGDRVTHLVFPVVR